MISILGGGIGGLALATILSRKGMECVVYEADASASARHQGGMLNINEDTGQQALHLAGLYPAFQSKVLHGADALRLADRDGRILLDEQGNGQRPEIDRGSLRQIFLDALDPKLVRWNTRVTDIQRTASGHELRFADGRRELASTLIGADGAWSRVRPLLSATKPEYLGISFVEYRYLRASIQHQPALAQIGDGLFFALADERGIVGHREPGDELCVYAAVKVPEDWHRQGITREQVLELFRDWGPNFQLMLGQSDGELIARPLYALPNDFSWQRVPGVTLLGDAAHVMSPFAGEGVNLAMADAADLARALLEQPLDIEAALASYEARLFPRAQAAARVSKANLEIAFAPDGGARFLEMFQQMVPPGD